VEQSFQGTMAEAAAVPKLSAMKSVIEYFNILIYLILTTVCGAIGIENQPIKNQIEESQQEGPRQLEDEGEDEGEDEEEDAREEDDQKVEQVRTASYLKSSKTFVKRETISHKSQFATDKQRGMRLGYGAKKRVKP
jgi:hypothetical protein